MVLVCGGLVLMLAMGTRQSFGLFLQPMSDALGWGRGTFALAIAFQNILWGLSQPLAGLLADKYGSGRVVALGGLAYAAGLYLMSRTGSEAELLLSAGFLLGFALSGTSFAVVLAAVGRAAPPDKQSTALGLASAGGSLGQFVMIPGVQTAISATGWSTALVVLALAALLLVPLAAGLAGRPRGDAAAGGRQSLGAALREARRHPGYRYLNAGFLVCGFQVTFIMVHLPAYLVDSGATPTMAALGLTTIGLFNIVGSLACGLLGDRYSKKYLLSLFYLARGAATVVFILVPVSNLSVLAYTATMGLLWLGTVPLTNGLVAQIFGTRYIATLFGIVFLSHQVGAFLGVWLGGYLFDVTGSYILVWWLVAGLGFVAAALHWPIDERALPRLASAR